MKGIEPQLPMDLTPRHICGTRLAQITKLLVIVSPITTLGNYIPHNLYVFQQICRCRGLFLSVDSNERVESQHPLVYGRYTGSFCRQLQTKSRLRGIIYNRDGIFGILWRWGQQSSQIKILISPDLRFKLSWYSGLQTDCSASEKRRGGFGLITLTQGESDGILENHVLGSFFCALLRTQG